MSPVFHLANRGKPAAKKAAEDKAAVKAPNDKAEAKTPANPPDMKDEDAQFLLNVLQCSRDVALSVSLHMASSNLTTLPTLTMNRSISTNSALNLRRPQRP